MTAGASFWLGITMRCEGREQLTTNDPRIKVALCAVGSCVGHLDSITIHK